MNELADLMIAGDYPGVSALLIFSCLAILKKVRPGTWERIPKNWRFLVPLGMAGLEALSNSLQLGWEGAGPRFLQAFLEGLLAMGMHGALTNSKVPYNDG